MSTAIHYFFLAFKDFKIQVHLHLVTEYLHVRFTFWCDLVCSTNLLINNNNNDIVAGVYNWSIKREKEEFRLC